MTDSQRFKAARQLWIGVFIFASLLVLGIRTLVSPDEGRYADMAREMLLSGDWITTRLNGLKYFEKPPLHNWMSALSFAVFGIGEWQARLWNAVCGMLGVLLAGYTGARIFGGRAGLYGASILASMLLWAGASQFNTLDIGVAATMTISLCALLIAQQDGASSTARHDWMLVCWGGMALSLLAKGLIGLVLPGGVLIVYSLLAADRGIWKRLHPWAGSALFLALALPWFVLIALKNPEQPHFFFIHEHWDRFFLKTHNRGGPWYYFLALLVPATMPWLPLLPAALMRARQRLPGGFQATRMLLIWVVLILFFFSYSNSKLPGYVLPIFPALAMLAGRTLDQASRRLALAPPLLLLVLGLAGLAWLTLGGMAGLSTEAVALLGMRRYCLLAGFIAAGAGGAAGCYAEWRGRRTAMVVVVAVGAWLLLQLSMAAYEPFGRRQSGMDLALAIRPELTASTPVYSVGAYEQSLVFYLQHQVVVVDYTDELEFGLQQQPERGIPELEEFYRRWNAGVARGEPQFAIVRRNVYQQLLDHGLPMRERVRNDRVVIVSAP
jgi:4-amino-4-deoxy-L-arabinose transferase-like glycosyltransferase